MHTHSSTVGRGNVSVREKTLKGAVSLGKAGSVYSMAVTGDETETGMSLLLPDLCENAFSDCCFVGLSL